MKIIIKFFYVILVFTNLNYLLANNNNLRNHILELDTKDFKKKIVSIEKISEIKTDLSLLTLKSILNGKLFIRKSDKKILAINKQSIKKDTYNKKIDDKSVSLPPIKGNPQEGK